MSPQAEVLDPVADALRKVNLPDPVRAQAWDVYNQSADEDALAAKLKGMALPDSVKADLWDLKHGAAVAQAPKAGPPSWTTRYPKTAQVVRGVLDALPPAGAILGGTTGTSVEPGGGTVLGAALGAGIGRGARDLAAEAFGIDEASSPLQKAGRIAGDVVLTAAVPGAIQAAKTPIQSAAEFGETYTRLIPPAVRKLLPSLEGLKVPTKAVPVLVRPAWQEWAKTAVERTLPDVPAAPAMPKPHFTNVDVIRIKSLIAQGIGEEQAVKTVQSLKALEYQKLLMVK